MIAKLEASLVNSIQKISNDVSIEWFRPYLRSDRVVSIYMAPSLLFFESGISQANQKCRFEQAVTATLARSILSTLIEQAFLCTSLSETASYNCQFSGKFLKSLIFVQSLKKATFDSDKQSQFLSVPLAISAQASFRRVVRPSWPF